ncbi:hypothetical protein C789_5566 [Microcystis aeruginosa FACHB-905 = DIANCHI905]|nr:hypothetical protein C789_5566 [Microcystis aeruginosa FACHB-905 = DIANCHI905]
MRSYLADNRIDTQIEAAKLLCQDLGYLPLALELVARLLKRRQDWNINFTRRGRIRGKNSLLLAKLVSGKCPNYL